MRDNAECFGYDNFLQDFEFGKSFDKIADFLLFFLLSS